MFNWYTAVEEVSKAKNIRNTQTWNAVHPKHPCMLGDVQERSQNLVGDFRKMGIVVMGERARGVPKMSFLKTFWRFSSFYNESYSYIVNESYRNVFSKACDLGIAFPSLKVMGICTPTVPRPLWLSPRRRKVISSRSEKDPLHSL